MTMRSRVVGVLILSGGVLASCGRAPADLLLINGRVYTLGWDEPSSAGEPARNAPHDTTGWHPDADAIAIRDGKIVYVGDTAAALGFKGAGTDVRDLAGATVLPGLVDSHVHLAELGASLERVNLVGARTEDEIVERVAQRAASVPAGTWIEGWGWDEGAWAGGYPDNRKLSARVPHHPVILRGLHGFAVWCNALALDRAGIRAGTASPAGGEIKKGKGGAPTGILLNTATTLVTTAVPAPTPDALDARLTAALTALAHAGYVSVEEAGADSALLAAFGRLRDKGALPIRVSAMLAARDTAALDAWTSRGPDRDESQPLVTDAVKAFYDGALGSRGAFLLADYADAPGRHGVGGPEYGFDRDRMTAMALAGFQLVVHAIGDRANRETLDLIEALERNQNWHDARPRIEHAQVVSDSDLPRFGTLGVIASMQPSHAVEDMAWAEARLGPDRIAGAYAWRRLRRAGARLVFNSDLPATDFSIFYGLHSAVTRQNRDGQPAGGWRPEEKMTIEEAVRGWTSWAAYAMFRDQLTGKLLPGRWADITVLDLDPFRIGETTPGRLLDGHVRLTVVNGRVVYAAQ